MPESAAFAETLNAISYATRLTYYDVGRIAGASERSVSRWRNGAAAPNRVARQRVLELAYIANELAAVLDSDHANLWILSPNRLLDDDTPAARIENGDFKSVAALIEALADGVVV
ncbi:MAG: hypothetical protein OXN44_13375 [Acidimicrobiaceae bacterium]|nr:hypothetical protein [Acidimicrobiaceae bacterium]